MKRNRIAAANWKMNLDLNEALALTSSLLDRCPVSDALKILFVPYPYLAEVRKLIDGRDDFELGAQDCSARDNGAFTGEVSAAMLRSVGVTHVIIGHSERRKYFSERAQMLNEKVNKCLLKGLRVVYCFGEEKSERADGRHMEVVRSQLEEVIGGRNAAEMRNIVLAYEPVWAIGTGETATTAQAQEMHAFVRKTVEDLCGSTIAESVPILYGGSCNSKNASELFSCQDVDGGLVGGASLKAEEFSIIAEALR